MHHTPVVLIVDDVKSNIQMLSMILEDDYEIKSATNGPDALVLAKESPQPDLVLLDVEMPGMDGYKVLHKLKVDKATENIPVIFVTGNVDSEAEERGFLLGAADYITKPVRPNIVRARVNTQVMVKIQRDELQFVALHDKLTGLYNRHYLTEFGAPRFAGAQRYDDDMCVIMSDVDHFKLVNDTYGHLGGDKVLQAMGELLKEQTRDSDLTARYGGEEFIIVLCKCDAQTAMEKAEEIRIALEAMEIDGIKVTSSFGVAQVRKDHKDFEALLKDADEALYQAKESGRNKTVIYKS